MCRCSLCKMHIPFFPLFGPLAIVNVLIDTLMSVPGIHSVSYRTWIASAS